MRILFVFSFHVDIGGHFKSALSFITYIKEMGHDIGVIVPGFRDEMIPEFTDIGVELRLFKEAPRFGGYLLSICGANEIIQLDL